MERLKAIISLFVEAGKKWNENRAARLAAALAYYTVFSLAPLLIIIVGIGGVWLGRSVTLEEVTTFFYTVFGPQTAQWLSNLVRDFTAPESLTLPTLISVAVMFWGASNVFNHLKETLNIIWGVTPKPGRTGIIANIRGRLLAFGGVFLAGFLLIAYLLATTLLSAALTVVADLLPDALQVLPTLRTVQLFQFLAGLVVFTVLVAILYKLLPDVDMVWRDVLVGAAFTSVLLSIGTLGLSLYFSLSSVGSLYGAAGSVLVILVWLYYSAQIFLFGAAFTEVYARRFGSRFRPTDYAVWVDVEERASEMTESQAVGPESA